ncbi:MAG TPA: hypothetical protein VJO15_02195, partial [Dehalococcoidia bacterium]|nr:hypothetical protein [Dehalococcoidia bacterium]
PDGTAVGPATVGVFAGPGVAVGSWPGAEQAAAKTRAPSITIPASILLIAIDRRDSFLLSHNACRPKNAKSVPVTSS